MKKINCLVADDELLARSVIENYISRFEHLNLVVSCSNGAEVVNALLGQSIDLIFLDINMPQLTGMELLKTMPDLPPVILTTAYGEYALESYQFKVVDYLLKPISFEAFVRAIQKFSAIFRKKQVIPERTPVMDMTRPFIYIRSEKKMVRIYYDEILYIEGLKDYVQIQLKDRKVITHQTMTSFEEKLPNTAFMRVHRSFIVSVPEIRAFTARAVEIGDKEIPIGEVYQAAVNERLR